MSKNTFKKIWFITIITLVITFTSVSIVAFWPIMVNPPESGSKDTTINIGSGGDIKTVLSQTNIIGSPTKELVPDHKDVKVYHNQTKSLDYEIFLKWEEDPLIEEADKGASKGAVESGKISFTYSIDYLDDVNFPGKNPTIAKDLFIVTFYIDDEVVDDNTVIDYNEEFLVIAKVTLKMPKDQTEYNAIKGTHFKVTITINVNLIEGD